MEKKAPKTAADLERRLRPSLGIRLTRSTMRSPLRGHLPRLAPRPKSGVQGGSLSRLRATRRNSRRHEPLACRWSSGAFLAGRPRPGATGRLRGQGLPRGSRVSFRCKEGSILVGRRETDGSCHGLARSRWSPDTAGRRAKNRQHRLVQTSVRSEHVPLLQEPGIAGWLGHLAPCFADEQRASRQVPW